MSCMNNGDAIVYVLQGIQLETTYRFRSFDAFIGKKNDQLPVITLEHSAQPWPEAKVSYPLHQEDIGVNKTAEGWDFYSEREPSQRLWVDFEYTTILASVDGEEIIEEWFLPILRTILEVVSLRQGILSLHSACVRLDTGAVCMSAESGMGKSTRADSWCTAFHAELLSGDRPQIKLTEEGALACGVPWDGKEKIYKNVQVPLLAVAVIRRSSYVRVRQVTLHQARTWLMQQCFIPMWDTELAFTAMRLVNRLCQQIPVYKVLCGPGEAEAREVYQTIFEHLENIKEAAEEMRIKEGFVLRNIMGDHIVMPAGSQIGKFKGAIVLNDVGAFIWEQLEMGICEEDLIESILTEFNVDDDTAKSDTAAYLKTLREYGALDES